MLVDLFESAARVEALREGPSGTLLDVFAQALVRSGYARLTARRHLRAAEHFAQRRVSRCWLLHLHPVDSFVYDFSRRECLETGWRSRA